MKREKRKRKKFHSVFTVWNIDDLVAAVYIVMLGLNVIFVI